MPELPEVEVTRRCIGAGLHGALVRAVQMGLPLRWPLGIAEQALEGTVCGDMTRRGKYLWLPLSRGRRRSACQACRATPATRRRAAC